MNPSDFGNLPVVPSRISNKNSCFFPSNPGCKTFPLHQQSAAPLVPCRIDLDHFEICRDGHISKTQKTMTVNSHFNIFFFSKEHLEFLNIFKTHDDDSHVATLDSWLVPATKSPKTTTEVGLINPIHQKKHDRIRRWWKLQERPVL